jgi:hypothetical protein
LAVGQSDWLFYWGVLDKSSDAPREYVAEFGLQAEEGLAPDLPDRDLEPEVAGLLDLRSAMAQRRMSSVVVTRAHYPHRGGSWLKEERGCRRLAARSEVWNHSAIVHCALR